MKNLLNIILVVTLTISMGTAIAETGDTAAPTAGFHAFSQLKSVDTQGVTVLTDEQLGDVVGGYQQDVGSSMITDRLEALFVTESGNPPFSTHTPNALTGELFATETGNPQKGLHFVTDTGNPLKSSWVVTRLNRGLGNPNPLDPDHRWGPIGPVVKPRY